MNKRILLGLLLMPCAVHTMEYENDIKITKYETDKNVTYAQHFAQTHVHATYYKDSNRYEVSESDFQGFEFPQTSAPKVVFENLQKQYDKQKMSKK